MEIIMVVAVRGSDVSDPVIEDEVVVDAPLPKAYLSVGAAILDQTSITSGWVKQ
jgi:hypothetical protein